jgi:hypothetical protein
MEVRQTYADNRAVSLRHRTRIRMSGLARRVSRVLVAVVAVSAGVLLSAGQATPQTKHAEAASTWCGGSVSWQAARRSVGELVRIRARVIRTYYATTSAGRPTFIDLGNAYPSPNRLTLLIWGRNRVNFPRAPETMFRRGTTVCAQGVVELYRGVAEIEVALYDSRERLLSF